jgi:hypothetical protein
MIVTIELEHELHRRLFAGYSQPIINGLSAQERLQRIGFAEKAYEEGFKAGAHCGRSNPYPHWLIEWDAWELGNDEGWEWKYGW